MVIIWDGVGGRLKLKSLDVCSLDEILRASSPVEEYPYRIFQDTGSYFRAVIEARWKRGATTARAAGKVKATH